MPSPRLGCFAVLLLVMVQTSGCIVTRVVVDRGVVVNGVPFPVPFRLETPTPGGFLVLHADGATNVSIFLRHEYTWDESRFNPLQVVYLLDDGTTFIPTTLDVEYPFEGEDPLYAGVGSLERDVGQSSPGKVKSEGVAWHFTQAKGGTLVVTWANLEEPARVDLFWWEGTTVRVIAEGTDVATSTLQDMRGGEARAGSVLATAHLGDAFVAGKPSMDLYSVVRVRRSWLGEGELTVRDESGEQRLPLAAPLDALGQRHVLTTSGETSFTARVVGMGPVKAHILSASIPKGILPERLSYGQPYGY